jgi:Domain of unknown function (DUF3859)
MTKRIAFFLLLLSCTVSGANAQSARVDRIDIIEKGIYQAETLKQVENSSTALGRTHTVGNIKNVESTTTVPARLGVRFGFRYKLIGSPNGVQVPIKIVTKFPAEGLRNPTKRETTYSDNEVDNLNIGGESYREYQLEENWEVVPGKWSFELWYNDKKMAEQTFTLIKP